MAEYKETIHTGKDKAKQIKKCLSKRILGDGELIVYSATFNNNMVMDIKCCGASDEPAWTESVLYQSDGMLLSEVGCSKVGDEFFGKWEFEYKGDKYIVNVVE